MAPYANEIPHLQSIHGPDLFQEYMDLLGDTRFRALRIHCLGLEQLIRMGFNQIPWDEAAVRALLNKLRDTEATPHKIQRIWDTLRWFSKRFGLLDVASLGRLQEKRKALQDQLTPMVSKPQRKALVPAFKMKKSPVPLIAPKYSFTGGPHSPSLGARFTHLRPLWTRAT